MPLSRKMCTARFVKNYIKCVNFYNPHKFRAGCGIVWVSRGTERTPKIKEKEVQNHDRNHRHFHSGIRRCDRHPDRYPLTEKQRGEKTMEFIVTAIIIAAASVVVTLIATRWVRHKICERRKYHDRYHRCFHPCSRSHHGYCHRLQIIFREIIPQKGAERAPFLLTNASRTDILLIVI